MLIIITSPSSLRLVGQSIPVIPILQLYWKQLEADILKVNKTDLEKNQKEDPTNDTMLPCHERSCASKYREGWLRAPSRDANRAADRLRMNARRALEWIGMFGQRPSWSFGYENYCNNFRYLLWVYDLKWLWCKHSHCLLAQGCESQMKAWRNWSHRNRDMLNSAGASQCAILLLLLSLHCCCVHSTVHSL